MKITIKKNQRLNILNNEMKNKMNQLIEEYNKLKETVKENEIISKNNLSPPRKHNNPKDNSKIKEDYKHNKYISNKAR